MDIFKLDNIFDVLDQPVIADLIPVKKEVKKNLNFSILINGDPILVKYESDLIINRINEVIDYYKHNDRDRVNCDFNWSDTRNNLEISLKVYKQTDHKSQKLNRPKTDFRRDLPTSYENSRYNNRVGAVYTHYDFLNCQLSDFTEIKLNGKKILFSFKQVKPDPNYIAPTKIKKEERVIRLTSINVYSQSFTFKGKKYQLKVNDKNEVYLKANRLEILIGYCEKEKIINYQWFNISESLPIADYLNSKKLDIFEVIDLEVIAMTLLDKGKTGSNMINCVKNEFINNQTLWLINLYNKLYSSFIITIDNNKCLSSTNSIIAIKKEVSDSYTVNFKPNQLFLKDFKELLNKVNKALKSITLEITDQVKIDQYKHNKLIKSLEKCFILYCDKITDYNKLYNFLSQEIINHNDLKSLIITFRHDQNNGLNKLFDQWLSFN